MIKVGMADLNVCKTPEALTTLGLGSCIGACIFATGSYIHAPIHEPWD